MKKLLLILLLAAAPLAPTGCSTAPSGRVVAVQTLGAIGISAKASINEAAQLLASGQITVAQFQKVASFYDSVYQPAYTLAVQAVRSDLSSVASPQLVGLAAQLAALVSQLTLKPASP
jgi:hypothetical protein